MKVLCVNNNAINNTKYDESLKYLKEGEVYTVIEEINYGGLAYILLEVKSTHPKGSFCIKHFIPLSEIDELELVNEKQLVNQ